MTGEHASIAKITRPSAKGIFQRKRLFRLLDIYRKYPVTWISGPAGSGKTTLVSSYIDVNKLPCLWYQIDEGDSDIATFFSYMGMAAKKAAPRKRTPLPLLTPEYLQGISTFTLRYFENLFSRFKAPYVLVFDNYHSVAADSHFHNMISDGLSTIPDEMNVIIISRHDLPPALSRLHANGLIGIFGWYELRLRLEETGGIVRLREKGKTPKGMIRRLHNAADGWAVGLVLMLESLKRGIEPCLVGKLTPDEIVDYFGNAFFNKTDKEIQDFLLKTAFLPKTTVKMAETLTGFPNAGNILLTLNRNNYFTEKHYSAEPVYQYHPLFREFLLSRAKEIYSSAVLSDLRHRAAILLEEAGKTEAAIPLFRDLGDWDAMVRLIMRQAPLMLEQGRYRPLEEWLDSLPKEMLENDPWLLYWKGASQYPFDSSTAHPYFEKAFDRFKIQGNLEGVLLGWSSVVDSIVWSMKDFSLLDQWIQKLPELPENPEESISPEIWIRTVSSMIITLAYRPRERSKTEEWVRLAVSIVQRPDSSFGQVSTLFHLFLYYLFTGDFEQLSITAQTLQRFVQSKKAVPLVVIMARMVEMTFYQSIGDYEKCLKAITDGLKTSEDTGILFAINILIGNAILSYQNLGDLEMAKSMLERMASSLDRQAPYEKGFYHLCQARQFLLRSELAAASVHAGLALRTALNTGAYYNIGLVLLLAAQVMHRIGRHEEAWTHLHEVFVIAERLSSRFLEYCGFMIESYFHFEEGNEASGLVSLRKALVLGKDRKLLNTFVDQPAVTARLCIKALEENIEVLYVQEIIRKRRLIPEKPPIHLENWPWPLKIYTLGSFGLLKDNKPFQFSGKVQKKPLLLLKALIALGGKDVREERLSDMLWPEADGDQAYTAFRTTLSRLRQLIGNEKAIDYHEGKATIDPRYCWVDAWAFESIFEQIEAESKRAGEDETRGHGEDEKVRQLIEQAINLYKGHFLADETGEFWTTSYRERLRNKYLLLITKFCDSLKNSEQWEKAVECYQRALDVDQLAEEFYQNLMICYRHLGQNAKAIEVYKRCRKILSAVLEIEPSPKTEAIYVTLIGKKKLI